MAGAPRVEGYCWDPQLVVACVQAVMLQVPLMSPEAFPVANTPVPIGAAPEAQEIPDGVFPVIVTRLNLAGPLAGNA